MHCVHNIFTCRLLCYFRFKIGEKLPGAHDGVERRYDQLQLAACTKLPGGSVAHHNAPHR
jgi:hypothetical protein